MIQLGDTNRYAAIVYDDGPTVDGSMPRLVRELIAAGVEVRGVVQWPPTEEGCGPGPLMKLYDLGSREILPLCQDLGRGASSCRLDTSALAAAAGGLCAAVDEPSDILFFPKFGKQDVNDHRIGTPVLHPIGTALATS